MSAHRNSLPESSNTALENIAVGFASGNLDDFPEPGHLDISLLDFNIPSLGHLDGYLLRVRNRLPRRLFFGSRRLEALPEASRIALILRIGAYVGEVIRRRSSDAYNWQSHSEIIAATPAHEEILGAPNELTTSFGIVSSDGQIWFPLNKVFKFLTNGPEDSLAFFANVAIHRQDKQT